ncbi:hypothetical protein N5U36_00260 [Aliarcobacter butzleri]|uniref:hypothetical protein n=1 Tax=Aliarcobacter butzleri TaxID=28197 RepID=UPI0021B395C2|nr:hypothetical protein [Aliarcobacter butzleri]MCT7633865.1 hypothetical protein [Aliarcobacter butzleri]
MIKFMLLTILIVFFQGCATWTGIKQDSNKAWEATKDTSSNVYHSVKKSIHEATE